METSFSTAGHQAPAAIEVPDLLVRGTKAGPWIVERELGRGGMGAVYAVVHEEIGKRAALKVVHGRLLGTGFNPVRMLVEARVVNQVGHPNIVDIFETGNLPDGRPYIVMERLEGQSLAHRADAGPIPPELSIAILRQICDGLIAAHAAGIVHRDLKLDNVFLVDNLDDPGVPKVKILDWGIAKIIHEDVRHTMEGQLVGTPQYLSPEQARGAQVSSKTDVYSLGVMAYELFLDQLPFEAETSAEMMVMHLRATPPPPHDLWPEIPRALEELLLQMLAKPQEQRPTMLEVATRLEAVLAELEGRRCSSEIAAQARPASISKPIPVPSVLASLQAARAPALPASLRIPVSLQANLSARTLRRMSADAHAPTRPAALRPRAQHWRYLVGGLAFTGAVALFLVTRDGDQIAAAAAPAPTTALEPATGIEAVIALPAAVPAPAGAPDVQEAALVYQDPHGTDRTVADHAWPAPAPTAARPHAARSPSPARRAITAGTADAAPAGPAASPAPHRPALAPPRRVKLDPDGTVDPYR